jgi:PadR family transcriptional regulator, regulatory protein AphA
MRESSQTQFAILGLLQLGPMSGYDLKQMVDESIGHFWREGWGRIYPTLHGLEAAGMVAKRTEKKTGQKRGRPERNVYTLRPAGRKRLCEWLSRDWTPEVYRNELLLKAFFGSNAAPGVMRRHVERFSEQCATEIATYEEIMKTIEGEHARNHPDAPFWKMTVSYGLHHSRALKEWAEETFRVLDGLAKEPATAAK